MNANDPAYPTPDEVRSSGLSKRELIAAMCLQGILSNPALYSEGRDIDNEVYNEVMIRKAVGRTDALILELSKEQPK